MVAAMQSPSNMEFLFQQATIVVDNARTHAHPASETSCHAEMPALCHFGSKMGAKLPARKKSFTAMTPSRKNKRRCGSFPQPKDCNRWESMSLVSAQALSPAAMSLSPPTRPMHRRCTSSDDVLMFHAMSAAVNAATSAATSSPNADCQPRQPRREPSLRTISLLDEALDVINSLELSVESSASCFCA